MTQVARPVLVKHAQQENNIESNDIPQPVDASWIRLANVELALSRQSLLRELVAAPASVRAMLGRSDGHSSDDDDEDGMVVVDHRASR